MSRWDASRNWAVTSSDPTVAALTLLVELFHELKSATRSLQYISDTLRCSNAQDIPFKLDRIAANTATKTRKRKVRR